MRLLKIFLKNKNIYYKNLKENLKYIYQFKKKYKNIKKNLQGLKISFNK